jgi:hypothetical protein
MTARSPYDLGSAAVLAAPAGYDVVLRRHGGATTGSERPGNGVEPAPRWAERRTRALEQIAAVLYWTAGLVATLCVVWLLGDVLLLVFAAALTALGLRGAADLLARVTPLGPGVSLLIVVVIILALFGATLGWAGPWLVSEAAQLQDQMLHQATALRAWLHTNSRGSELLPYLPPALGGSADSAGLVPGFFGTIAGALSPAIGAVGTAVLIIAAALYFVASPEPYVNGPLLLVPHRHRNRIRDVPGTVGSRPMPRDGVQPVPAPSRVECEDPDRGRRKPGFDDPDDRAANCRAHGHPRQTGSAVMRIAAIGIRP